LWKRNKRPLKYFLSICDDIGRMIKPNFLIQWKGGFRFVLKELDVIIRSSSFTHIHADDAFKPTLNQGDKTLNKKTPK